MANFLLFKLKSIFDIGRYSNLFIYFDSLVTLLPVPRADFTMLVGELEGLNQSRGLIHRSSYWVVIHCEAPNLALWVYDEDIFENTSTFDRVSNVHVIHCLFTP